jgi:hypothetical protein
MVFVFLLLNVICGSFGDLNVSMVVDLRRHLPFVVVVVVDFLRHLPFLVVDFLRHLPFVVVVP